MIARAVKSFENICQRLYSFFLKMYDKKENENMG